MEIIQEDCKAGQQSIYGGILWIITSHNLIKNRIHTKWPTFGQMIVDSIQDNTKAVTVKRLQAI